MTHKKELILISVVVIIIQLLFAIPIFYNINRALLPFSDAIRYNRLARNLIENHTYSRDSIPPYHPEIFVPPGYPAFIAFFYTILGKNPILIIIIQIILSCLTGFLTFLFAKKFIDNQKIALFAGILFGLSPNIAFHSTKLISESLFTLLLILALYLLLVSVRKQKESYLLIAGFIMGLATYVRTIAIYFPILIFVILLIWYKKAKVHLAGILGFIIIYLVTLTPWIIRNSIVFKKPIFATTGEVNIFLYNAPTVLASEKGISLTEARDTIWNEVQMILTNNPELDSTNEVIRAQIGSRVGLKYIFRYPLTYTKIHAISFILNFIVPIGVSPLIQYLTGEPLTELKIRPRVMQDALALFIRGKIKQAFDLVLKERFYNLSPIGFLILIWAGLFQLFIMVGVIIGLVRFFKNTFYLLIPIIYFTLATGPVCDARLRVPIEPLLIILAGIGYFSLCQNKEFINSMK
ncbi:MAG: glycosyltransferase family 39 protein [candidate division WOR-3 bacterium]